MHNKLRDIKCRVPIHKKRWMLSRISQGKLVRAPHFPSLVIYITKAWEKVLQSIVLYGYPHHKANRSHCSRVSFFHVFSSLCLLITSDHITLKPGWMILLFIGFYELLTFSFLGNAITIKPGFFCVTT